MGSNFNSHPDLKVAARFTIGAEVSNAINVGVQLVDRENGNDISERVALGWYLASDANGDAVSAAPQTGIAIGTDGVLIEWTNNVSGMAISEADGDLDVTITDTGTATFYLVLIAPDGKLYVSGAITFA